VRVNFYTLIREDLLPLSGLPKKKRKSKI